VKGGREGLSSCVLDSLKTALTKTAYQHGVSRSWVVAVIVANFYGIEVEHYDQKEAPTDERTQARLHQLRDGTRATPNAVRVRH
jgi:hypothetical protein